MNVCIAIIFCDRYPLCLDAHLIISSAYQRRLHRCPWAVGSDIGVGNEVCFDTLSRKSLSDIFKYPAASLITQIALALRGVFWTRSASMLASLS